MESCIVWCKKKNSDFFWKKDFTVALKSVTKNLFQVLSCYFVSIKNFVTITKEQMSSLQSMFSFSVFIQGSVILLLCCQVCTVYLFKKPKLLYTQVSSMFEFMFFTKLYSNTSNLCSS